MRRDDNIAATGKQRNRSIIASNQAPSTNRAVGGTITIALVEVKKE